MAQDSHASPGVDSRVVDGVAVITLARPEQGNALDLRTAETLLHAVDEAAASTTVRTIVLRGAGARFCVGGDLQAFRQAPEGARLCDEVARPLHAVIELMHRARQPVICAVHGAVGGGAIGLVLAADLVIAAETTVFRLGYTGSGLSPDCGVTWELPHRVGMARATDLILTNRRFDAAEAVAMGVVSRVVPDDGVELAIADAINAMSKVPVETLAQSKRLLRRALTTSLHDQLEDEARTIGWIGDTPDSREAIAAFLNKRAATFSG